MVSGIIVLAIVILVAVVLAVLGRLRMFGLAVRRTRLRAEQAQRLQVKIVAMQERIEGLQAKVETVAATAEQFKANRG